jgi:hypothetical protein
LRTVDLTVLTAVVRQDQRSPAFELVDWTVAPLSHHKIIDTTGGLYCFSGRGRDAEGERPWSVVLKILNGSGDDSQNQRHPTYWRREVLAFQSGLLSSLPGPIVAPRGYGVREYDGGAWIWMEHIVEATERRWSPEDYRLAARQFGAFAGAYLGGVPRPDAPWLTDGVCRGMLADGEFFAVYMDPAQPGNAWESDVTQQWFPEPRRSRTLAVWADKRLFFDAFDRPPQVFCHLDSHRRNLMIRRSAVGTPEIVAIDWSFCGRGPIGADAAVLVMDSLFYFELEPTAVKELEANVLDGYLTGLHDAGWHGDPALIRLGYTAEVALWYAATLPGWTAYLLGEVKRAETTQQFGRTVEEIAAGWLTLWEYAQECVDEARSLIRRVDRA